MELLIIVLISALLDALLDVIDDSIIEDTNVDSGDKKIETSLLLITFSLVEMALNVALFEVSDIISVPPLISILNRSGNVFTGVVNVYLPLASVVKVSIVELVLIFINLPLPFAI